MAPRPATGRRSSSRGGPGEKSKPILKRPPAAHAAAAGECRPGSAALEHVRGQRPPGPRAQPRPARAPDARPGRRRSPGVALLRKGEGDGSAPKR